MVDLPDTKPYLVRALYEWCCDAGQTPYVCIKMSATVRAPLEFVRNGEIIFNISADATRDLKIDNESISFSARFSGVTREVFSPISNVKGIFAKESGQGLSFEVSIENDESNVNADQSSKAHVVSSQTERKLRVVK
jgi:stringent starvation protein B